MNTVSTFFEQAIGLRRALLPVIGALALLAAAAGDAGAAYSVARWTVYGGSGGPAAGGVFQLWGTAGQPDAGSLAGGAYALLGGFWPGGSAGTVDVEQGPGGDPDDPEAAPFQLRMMPPTPNPAQARARIEFELPDTRQVSVGVYDIHGRLVRRIASGTQEAGRHLFQWDMGSSAGQRVGAGVYFVRMQLGDAVQSYRLVVIR